MEREIIRKLKSVKEVTGLLDACHDTLFKTLIESSSYDSSAGGWNTRNLGGAGASNISGSIGRKTAAPSSSLKPEFVDTLR